MKSEKAMGELLKQVTKECQNESIAVKLKKIGAAFIGKKVVGMPESVMRQNSMWMIKQSRKVTFVSGESKDEQVSLPKMGRDFESLEDGDEDIFMKSIHDRYAARPNNLSDKCLAYFAVNYDSVDSNEESSISDVEDDPDHNSEEHGNEEGNGHTTNRQNEIITLKDCLGKMRKRKQESILRTKKIQYKQGT